MSESNSHDGYKKFLEDCEVRMQQNHAYCVKDLLYKAQSSRREAQAALPDFRDNVSPFLVMSPLNGEVGTGSTGVDFKHYMARTGVKTRKVVPTSKVAFSEERYPRYKHYVPLVQSILTHDVRQLQYEPYMGDDQRDDQREELMEQYDGFKQPDASRMAEYISRLNGGLAQMLQETNIERTEVKNAVANPGTCSHAFSFATAFQEVFDVELKDVLTDESEDSEGLQELSPRAVRTKEPAENYLSTYESLTCFICNAHECGIHGQYEARDPDEGTGKGSEPVLLYERVNIENETLIARRNEEIARWDDEHARRQEEIEIRHKCRGSKYCSDDCYLIEHDGEQLHRPSKLGETDFDHHDIQYIKTILETDCTIIFPYCSIASHLGKTCREVYNKVLKLNIQRLPIPRSKIPREAKRLAWYDTKKKKIDTSVDWGLLTKTHVHQNRDQPRGCEHPERSCAEAGQDCSCIRDEILCEKFCGCPRDCYMRYTGCDCNHFCMQSQNCSCWLLNRECDPELCHSSSKEWHNCGNEKIQLRQEKRLVLAESSVKGIGYGVFLAEPVVKGDYIIEYVGETISQGEADRRGRVYDNLDASYLFDLNAHSNIDAFRYGNESRFINHDDKSNCEARVLLVNGEHRIGFYATKAMTEGQELFFNYGPLFVRKMGLLTSGGTLMRSRRKNTRSGAGRARGKISRSNRKGTGIAPVSPAKVVARNKSGKERSPSKKAGRRASAGVASKFAPSLDFDDDVARPVEGLEMEEVTDDVGDVEDVEDEEMEDIFEGYMPVEVMSSDDEYEDYDDGDGEIYRRSGRRAKKPLKYTR